MDMILSRYRSPLGVLRLQWLGLVVLASLFFFAGFLGLRIAWDTEHSARWMALASVLGVYLLAVFWRGLDLNHRPGEASLLPGLGPGNLLTFLRGLLTAALAGFLFSPLPPGWLAWLPGALYTSVGIADLFDGYVARRTRSTTLLGERLDMSLDGLGVLVGSALLVQYGQVPPWFLLVGLARYLFLLGTWLQRQTGRPVYDLPPSSARRPLAGTQMVLIGVLLFPLLAPPGTHLGAALFALPFLAGFSIDFLVAIGAVRAPVIPAGLLFTAARKFLAGPGAFGLRLAVAFMLAWVAIANIHGLPPAWTALILVLATPAAILLTLGVAGRFAALAAMFAIGIQDRFLAADPAGLFVVLGSALLFYIGAGCYSLWNPEQRLIARRPGED